MFNAEWHTLKIGLVDLNEGTWNDVHVFMASAHRAGGAQPLQPPLRPPHEYHVARIGILENSNRQFGLYRVLLVKVHTI